VLPAFTAESIPSKPGAGGGPNGPPSAALRKNGLTFLRGSLLAYHKAAKAGKKKSKSIQRKVFGLFQEKIRQTEIVSRGLEGRAHGDYRCLPDRQGKTTQRV
jgi:hypothetical protein